MPATIRVINSQTVIQAGENTIAAAASAAEAAASVAALEIDLWRVTQGLVSDVFVDSDSGSDAATGLSLPRAKLTLTAAEALLSGSLTALGIVGSTFNEQLTLTQDAEVLSVGAGDIPAIDGADVATGWTAEGTANVWQKTGWTHTMGSSSNRFLVFEDGEMLVRVANAAACSALPGSFVDVRASAGSPVTLKIHPTGSGNPNTNGKLYEASRREAAISAAAGYSVVVRGPIEVGRAVGNNGSIQILGEGLIERVLATFGTKHNFFMGNGTARDCLCYAADKPTSDEGGNTAFVTYMDDPTGENYAYERCGAFIPASNGTAFSGHLPFFAHAGTVGPEHTTGSLVQCWGVGPILAGHAGGAATITDLGNYWRALTFTASPTAIDHKIDQMLAYIYTTIGGASAATTILDGHELENCAVYFEKRISTDAPAMRTESGDIVLDRTTLVMGGPGAFGAHAFITVATSGSKTCNYSVIAGFSGNLLDVATGVTYTGDNNVFWCDNEFATSDGFEGVWHGAGYTTLSAWQAATGQDANSVYAIRADQAAGDADALFLGWAEADGGTDLTTVGPAVGDFRLNPTAKLYTSAGTVRTGTLADGTTPIVGNCGAQAHWDWNLRQSISGPPTAFPAVPETLAEHRRYIRNPRVWPF